MTRTKDELRAEIDKVIQDCLIPGCGREDDSGEPSYRKFVHEKYEDGCYGCDQKLTDWIADFSHRETLAAVAEERERCAKLVRRLKMPMNPGHNSSMEAVAQIIESGRCGMEKPEVGKCCSCGYDGNSEQVCYRREDTTHCDHWWEGEDADAIRDDERRKGK